MRRKVMFALLLVLIGVAGYRFFVVGDNPVGAIKEFFGVPVANQASNPTIEPFTDSLPKLKEAAPESLASDHDWPQWLGKNRDGRADSTPLAEDWEKEPPRKVWFHNCGGGYSSITIADGRLYLQDYLPNEGERLLCFDAVTGKELWVHKEPADYKSLSSHAAGPRAAPCVRDGKIYALGAVGTFLCLKLPEGTNSRPELLWKVDLVKELGGVRPGWGFASSPLVEGNQVIIQAGGKAKSITALDAATGKFKWGAGDAGIGYSSPTIATLCGVRQIVALSGTKVYGVTLEGNLLWSSDFAPSNQVNAATPLVIGDRVFVSAGYGKGCALLEVTKSGENFSAKPVYTLSGKMANHHSNSVERDGFLYGYDENVLRCMELKSGKFSQDWVAKDTKNAPFQKGSIILAGSKLIGQTHSGTLFFAEVDSEQFQCRGRLDGIIGGAECYSTPVLVDGRLYVRDNNRVVCLDIRPSKK